MPISLTPTEQYFRAMTPDTDAIVKMHPHPPIKLNRGLNPNSVLAAFVMACGTRTEDRYSDTAARFDDGKFRLANPEFTARVVTAP